MGPIGGALKPVTFRACKACSAASHSCKHWLCHIATTCIEVSSCKGSGQYAVSLDRINTSGLSYRSFLEWTNPAWHRIYSQSKSCKTDINFTSVTVTELSAGSRLTFACVMREVADLESGVCSGRCFAGTRMVLVICHSSSLVTDSTSSQQNLLNTMLAHPTACIDHHGCKQLLSACLSM